MSVVLVYFEVYQCFVLFFFLCVCRVSVYVLRVFGYAWECFFDYNLDFGCLCIFWGACMFMGSYVCMLSYICLCICVCVCLFVFWCVYEHMCI